MNFSNFLKSLSTGRKDVMSLKGCWLILIGPLTTAIGCGYLAHPSSISTTEFTPLLHLGRSMILMGTTSGISFQCWKTCRGSTFTSLGLPPLAFRRKPNVLLAKTTQNQWLIMILQPKSVERGWEKLMPRIALIPTLPKGNLQTCRAENGLTVTKMPLTRPLPGNWRLVDLTDAQPISCGSITKWSCDNGGGLHQPSVVS